MAYRDDLTALAARHDALAGEVAEKTRELEESRALLAQAEARAKLPVLDNIRVASPCTADWSQMTGDDRTRHCGSCRKNVYNLSDMTRDEAEALILERNGDLCVRYFQRHDGTILLADCTVGRGARSRHRWIAAGAAGVITAGIAVGVAAQHLYGPGSGRLAYRVEIAVPRPPPLPLVQPPSRHHPPEPVQVIMGGIGPPSAELLAPPAARNGSSSKATFAAPPHKKK